MAATGSTSSWDPLISLTFKHPTLVLLEKCKTREQLKQILAQMIRLYITGQIFPMSRLIHQSAARIPGARDLAAVLFNHFTPQPNLYIFNTMISAMPNSEFSLPLYKSMLQSSVYPDKQTFLSLLRSSICPFEGKKIHGHAVITGLFSHSYLMNSFMRMYMESGHMRHAQQIFEQMPYPDIISWNIMVHGYAKNGWNKEALKLFQKMKCSGLMPDEFSMVNLLMICGQLGDLRHGKSLHAFHMRNWKLFWGSNLILSNALLNFYVKCDKLELSQKVFDLLEERDVISWNTLMTGYVKHGKLELAGKIFQRMPHRDLVSWNCLIAGYSLAGNSEAASELLSRMLLEKIRPDNGTLLGLISAAADYGHHNQGRSIHGWVIKDHLGTDAFISSALIDMYCKCGCIGKALTIFERVDDKDVTVWTGIISGLALHGHGSQALEMFYKMQETVTPNNVTFVAVLTACAHSGMVDQGCHIFNSMKVQHGIEPEVEHYGCLIDLLARSGRLTEARLVISNMPVRPSKSMWGSVLSACKAYGDINLAKIASRELLILEPEREGAYILMANLYAASGKWRYCDDIRTMMMHNEVKKKAGCSWVEIDGVLNEFIATDKRHTRWVDIFCTLDILTREMRSDSEISA